jgi:tight adherence protein B
VRRRSQKRTAKLEEQLPDVLDMMASMLRAGHSLPSTLALLSEEIPAPIGDELRQLHGEWTYGNSAEDAMNHLVERTRSEDIRCFVMAILVQRETGGNLTNMLTDLAGIIRERLKLFGKIRALSAEGRLSAWVLTLMPIVCGAAIYSINAKYLEIFWLDPTGIKMFEAMIVMLLFGNVWMRKLVRIRV